MLQLLLLVLALEMRAEPMSGPQYAASRAEHRLPGRQWMLGFELMARHYAFEPNTTHFMVAPRGADAQSWVLAELHRLAWNATLASVGIIRAEYTGVDPVRGAAMCYSVKELDDPQDNRANYRAVALMTDDYPLLYRSELTVCEGEDFPHGPGKWLLNVVKLAV